MKKKEEAKIRKEASSKSIHLTFSDIERMLSGEKIGSNGSQLRDDLRSFVLSTLIDEKKKSWIDGFRYAHKITGRRTQKRGEFPEVIKKSMTLELLPGHEITIVFRSKAKPKKLRPSRRTKQAK